MVNPLDDIFCWDAQTCWAVGERGTILHTSDGGATWQWQAGPRDAELTRVEFVAPEVGWILGERGVFETVLLHTEDSGATWVERQTPFDGGCCWSDMTWSNAETGWVMEGKRLWRTTDGGQTWSKMNLPTRYTLGAVASVDGQHAWVTGGDDIMRTNDGGENWQTYSLPVLATSLAFVDSQTGWAVGIYEIAHTTDGGQTWKVQHHEMGAVMEDVGFFDDLRGWVVEGWGTRLWVTTDGGVTWQARETPEDRLAGAFLDTQCGWVVGGWQDGKRTTIAYTSDGGLTWQIQDTHIRMPSLAYTSADYLGALLTERDPTSEALVVQLLRGPCSLSEHHRLELALRNLGWNGTRWGHPPSEQEDLDIERLDVDLDGDGTEEIVLFGGRENPHDLFLGVLDWDGIQWQVAWFEQFASAYNGNIRVSLEDLNLDGRPELWAETLVHPYSGSSILGQEWNVSVYTCEHLLCHAIWTATLGRVDQGCGGHPGFHASSRWRGGDYDFIRYEGKEWPEIRLLACGAEFDLRVAAGNPMSRTLTAAILPTVQTTYGWNGTEYSPTLEVQLGPGRTLETRPLTETIDLDGDGQMERAVFRLVGDCSGLWQTLSIYSHAGRDEWQLTQAFTVAVTGVPTAGITLRDANHDDKFEIVGCSTSFVVMRDLNTIAWPSMIPQCTVYEWGPGNREE